MRRWSRTAAEVTAGINLESHFPKPKAAPRDSRRRSVIVQEFLGGDASLPTSRPGTGARSITSAIPASAPGSAAPHARRHTTSLQSGATAAGGEHQYSVPRPWRRPSAQREDQARPAVGALVQASVRRDRMYSAVAQVLQAPGLARVSESEAADPFQNDGHALSAVPEVAAFDDGRRRSAQEIDEEMEEFLRSGMPSLLVEAQAEDARVAGLAALRHDPLKGLDVDLGSGDARRGAETAADATLRNLARWNGGAIAEMQENADTAKASDGSTKGLIDDFGEGILRVRGKLRAVQQQCQEVDGLMGGMFSDDQLASLDSMEYF